MALNFPNSPTAGQVHNDNGGSWTWNGTAWISGTTPNQLNGLPIGTLIWHAGKRVPNGFLVANGAPVTPIYPTLRDMLIADGNPFGTNGTDPLLPNMHDRTAVGSGTSYTVGQQGGVSAIALTAAQLPAHTHTLSGNTGSHSNDHTHTFSGTTGGESVDHSHGFQPLVKLGAGGGLNGEALSGGPVQIGQGFAGALPASQTGGRSAGHVHGFSGTTAGTSTNHTHTLSGTTSSIGSGATHENMPPYTALLPCVKAYDALNVSGVLNLRFATQAEAQAGVSTDTLMSPLNTKQAIDSQRPFATEAEARAGVATDKLMSPALVRALSGVITPSGSGTTEMLFSGIPPDATELTLIYLLTLSANTQHLLVRPNGISAGYVANTVAISGAGTVASVVSDTTGMIVYGLASSALQGTMTFTRLNPAGATWITTHAGRRATDSIMHGTGLLSLNADFTSLRLRGGGLLVTGGSSSLLWRI